MMAIEPDRIASPLHYQFFCSVYLLFGGKNEPSFQRSFIWWFFRMDALHRGVAVLSLLRGTTGGILPSMTLKHDQAVLLERRFLLVPCELGSRLPQPAGSLLGDDDARRGVEDRSSKSVVSDGEAASA
jgi:hypothetical protein